MTMHFGELPQLWLQWCGQIRASPKSCTADNTWTVEASAWEVHLG